MGVVHDLLRAIRTKRKERFSSVAEQYDAAVGSLARGHEVDVDELATWLDALDLSDSDLESDVKAKQRRHEIASQIRGMESTEKQLEKNEKELARLQDEIEQFLTPRKARVSELFQTIRMQQAEVGSKQTLLHDLLHGPSVPRHLQARRDELNARRKVWGSKLREYEDATSQPRTMVRQLTGHLEVLDGKISRAIDSAEAGLLRGQRSQVEQEQKRYQNAIDALSSDKVALDAELREIEKLEAELNRQLMVP